MAGEKERVNAYLDTIKRFEPDIAMTDAAAYGASIAISLKRLADSSKLLIPIAQQLGNINENLIKWEKERTEAADTGTVYILLDFTTDVGISPVCRGLFKTVEEAKQTLPRLNWLSDDNRVHCVVRGGEIPYQIHPLRLR